MRRELAVRAIMRPLAATIAAAVLSACSYSPLGLRTDVEIGRFDRDAVLDDVPTRGALTTIMCRIGRGGFTISGELLAVEPDAVWLYRRAHVVRIDRRCITLATVERHPSLATHTAAWTTIGALSTAAHGAAAFLTGSLWLALGAAVAADHAALNDARVPPHALDRMRPFARFPAGRPPRYYAVAVSRTATPTAAGQPVQYYVIGAL